ncbi:MAG: hypothetical protein ABR583_10540 [Gaiellaceae bacterium]
MTPCMNISARDPSVGRVGSFTHEYELFPPRFTCIFRRTDGTTLRVERTPDGTGAFFTVLAVAGCWFVLLAVAVPLRRWSRKLAPLG